jgi:hypothetical protein
MTGLDDYLTLAINPIIAAPLQFLYLKAGKRYDVGAVFVIATGAFLGSFVLTEGHKQEVSVLSVLALLLPLSLVTMVVRIVALAAFTPMIFTLLALAQMWAVQPLITYGLEQRQEFSVYVGQLAPGWLLFLGSLPVSIFVMLVILRLKLPSRLRALSDSPLEYRLLMGSSLPFAIGLEVGAFLTYLSAGFAFRMAHANLSPDNFNNESLWMLLSVAALPRFSWWLVVIGPLATTGLRYAVASVFTSTSTAIMAYVLLSVILAFTALYEVKTQSVQRA